MQYQLRAHAVLAVEEPAQLHRLARLQPGHGHRHLGHRHPAYLALDLALEPRLGLPRPVRQLEAEQRDARGRIAQRLDGGKLAAQRHFVGFHPYAAASGAGAAAGAGFAASSVLGAVSDLDFSSFIIGEGAVTAASILTMRWRRTASLNLKAWSSSSRVSPSHSTFIST